jgi:hypothetical protein
MTRLIFFQKVMGFIYSPIIESKKISREKKGIRKKKAKAKKREIDY